MQSQEEKKGLLGVSRLQQRQPQIRDDIIETSEQIRLRGSEQLAVDTDS
jgi:hypothetical protein